MSELINARNSEKNFRWRLLSTVSAMALMASIYGGQPATASDDDTDHPVLWIELGGQLERLDSPQVPVVEPYFDTLIKDGFESPLEAGKNAIYSNGAEATISFTPEGSDWVFSGSVLYGRANGSRVYHKQIDQIAYVTIPLFNHYRFHNTLPPNEEDTRNRNSETHLIADFQAGKDVGLGLFGSESTATLSVGLRFAQFSEKSDLAIRGRPSAAFVYVPTLGIKFPFVGTYHKYYNDAQRAASFKGIGPSISWNASTPFLGSSHDGELAFDWGANAAVLFGKQKTRVHHRSTETYRYGHGAGSQFVYLPTHHATHTRSRAVVVPNIGGFAGLAYKFPNAKISVGYRADFFFGAIDGGIDTAKSENRGFFGPFASISVGIP